MRKYTILLVVLLLLFSCTAQKFKEGNEYFKAEEVYEEREILKKYGTPVVSMIILKEGSETQLYEYQNGLVKYIPAKDSLYVKQYSFHRGNIHVVIWGIPKGNDKIKILDALEWDEKEVQF